MSLLAFFALAFLIGVLPFRVGRGLSSMSYSGGQHTFFVFDLLLLVTFLSHGLFAVLGAFLDVLDEEDELGPALLIASSLWNRFPSSISNVGLLPSSVASAFGAMLSSSVSSIVITTGVSTWMRAG